MRRHVLWVVVALVGTVYGIVYFHDWLDGLLIFSCGGIFFQRLGELAKGRHADPR